LSFLYEPGPPLAGDIALCLPVLREEASAAGVSTGARIAHLLVHAVLHLQGYDHESEQDAAIMEALESKIVTSLGFADPYADETDPALRFSPQSSFRSPQSSPL
jgi:probable rRNA maturation factor